MGRKTVELGHRVQPGQGLLMIVPLDDIWITANFKETQLKSMRAGEPVAHPRRQFGSRFQGKVENLPGAAGPLFSLFPPENATGNYVKVVQRFPVRIRLNKGEDPQHLLRPGMSVEPRVTFVIADGEDRVQSTAAAEAAKPRSKSLADRRHRHAGNLHGAARYVDRQRRRCPISAAGLGRSYDEVTWILTTYLVANAVVLPMSAWLSRVFGTEELLPGMRGAVHADFVFLRPRALARDHAFEPRAARDRRRRTGAGGAGHSGGYVSRRRNAPRHSLYIPS